MSDILAFPQDRDRRDGQPGTVHEEGMLLRDYFAIHAIYEEIVMMGFNYEKKTYLEKVVEARYKYADAMLKAREIKNGN